MKALSQRTGIWWTWVLLLVALSSALSFKARAESYNPFLNEWEGQQELFSGDAGKILALGTGLTIVSLYFDPRISNYFFSHSVSLGTWSDSSAQFLKVELVPGLIAGATLTYGLLSGSRREISGGQGHLEALLLYAVDVATLKFFTYRDGPGGDSLHHAFPSGQFLFVSAGNISGNYGWQWGLPLTMMGLLGEVEYMFLNVHWTSDLIFGAFLGYATGLAFAKYHIQKDNEAASANKVAISCSPIVEHTVAGGSSYGASLHLQF